MASNMRQNWCLHFLAWERAWCTFGARVHCLMQKVQPRCSKNAAKGATLMGIGCQSDQPVLKIARGSGHKACNNKIKKQCNHVTNNSNTCRKRARRTARSAYIFRQSRDATIYQLQGNRILRLLYALGNDFYSWTWHLSCGRVIYLQDMTWRSHPKSKTKLWISTTSMDNAAWYAWIIHGYRWSSMDTHGCSMDIYEASMDDFPA